MPISNANSINAYKVNQFYTNRQQLDRASIVHIRGYILNLLNKLMFTLPSVCDEKDLNSDEEFQAIFNYIATVNEVLFLNLQ